MAEENPASLFLLSGRAVSSAMERLEREVWGLPGQILQSILPLLNIYYLERIEETVVKKGISTESIWRKLWEDVIKTRPPRSHEVTCWRKKFLNTFFSHVLHGILDVSSDPRLSDPRFSPLLHSSRHLTLLTIYNKLQGTTELIAEHNQSVLGNLAGSLQTLNFQNLSSSDQSSRRSLSLLLHRLVHHGVVSQLAISSWVVPDWVLLDLILRLSAGVWQPGKMLGSHDSRCSLCRVQSATQHPVENETDQDLKVSLKVPQKPNSNSTVSVNLPRNGSESLALPARSGSRSDPCQDARFETEVERDGAGEGSSHPSRQPSLPAGLLPQKRCRRVMDEVGRKRPRRTSRRTRPDPEDLYDFIFAVAREEEELDSHSERQKAHEAGSTAGASPFPVGTSRSERGESDTIPSLQAPGRFRSVSKLELFFVSMTDASWRMLATLLSSWVALEELTLHFNDLGPCLSHLLSGLQSLSRCRDYRLRSLDMNDVFSTVPCAEVIRLFLSAVPQLSALSVGFELEEIRSEGNASSFEDIPETHLEKLAIIFPNERLQTSQLLPALKASRHLQQLSLKNATVSGPQELGLLLRALREWNPNLKRLDFHDINLANREREVLLLLRDSTLQAITFSFCRLFENCSAEFLAEIINAVKRNPTLRLLGLPGNRLGDHRLVALADIFSKDSVSSIYQLDLSSNCIKPDGLLEFAKKLEAHIAQRGEPISCRHLFFSWNHLDKDAGTTREALRRLKTVCSVTSDSWDATQALADFISVM